VLYRLREQVGPLPPHQLVDRRPKRTEQAHIAIKTKADTGET